MLSVKNISKTFKNGKTEFQALKDVSVEIVEGEIFGFIGLSGAGKTSLARCISMLEKPDGGEILLDGADLTKLSGERLRDTRKKMGLVFQQFNLLMNSNVYENVAFPMKIAKKPAAYIEKKVDELLELTGLSDKKFAYPSKLSGGQKQRVGIARALSTEPELVICDEATSALDPETTKSILALIKSINEKTGVTFIIITHEMDVIKDICDRVAVMEGGEIIEQGKVIDVVATPKSQTAKRFFKRDGGDFDASRYSDVLANGDKIIRATFIGESALRPFISDIIRRYDVEVSILSGGLEEINGTIIGTLNIKITGSDEAFASSLQYFKDSNVRIEVIHDERGDR